MAADLKILETITAWYPHPCRLFYTRCWGCGKRRIFGEWWEGYQVGKRLAAGSTLRHWGYFCSSCIVIVAGQTVDSLHAQIEQAKSMMRVLAAPCPRAH